MKTLKRILIAILALVLVMGVCACKKEKKSESEKPGGFQNFTKDDLEAQNPNGTDDLNTATPTSAQPQTEAKTVCTVKLVDVAKSTITFAYYEAVLHLAGEVDANGKPYENDFCEIVDSKTTKTLKVDKNTVLLFGDIFDFDGVGELDNKKVDLEYFAKNSTRSFRDNERLYFNVDDNGTTLKKAELWWQYYYAG